MKIAFQRSRPAQALLLEVEARAAEPGTRTAARPFRSVLASLATGGGKTRVAAALLERRRAARGSSAGFYGVSRRRCRGACALFVVNRAVLARQVRVRVRRRALVEARRA